MSTATVPHETFRHEVLLYEGDEGFVAGVAPFLREGVARGEPALVVVASYKIDLLRDALGGEAEHVLFADMAEIGQNPARIIPAWDEFEREHVRPDRPARGVGEPIWAERPADELVECQRHESLLNVAFAGSPAWRLLCPYDLSKLPPAVIDEALRTHPYVVADGVRRPSDRYRGLNESGGPFSEPLPDPPGGVQELAFDVDSLGEARRRVYWRAAGAGLGLRRTNDLVLAVNEILTNSVRHGGGAGVLRLWENGGAVVCEVRDRGRIADPLVDRRRPCPDRGGGRGLWMANQLCDLVQIRSMPDGTIVRVSMRNA